MGSVIRVGNIPCDLVGIAAGLLADELETIVQLVPEIRTRVLDVDRPLELIETLGMTETEDVP